MEGASKERLTGAVILVAALAIAVPELLSGPGENAGAKAGAGAVADAGPPLATYELAINPGASSGAARQQELAASAAREQSEAIAQAVPPPVTAPVKTVVPEPAPAAQPTPAVVQQPASPPAERQSLPDAAPVTVAPPATMANRQAAPAAPAKAAAPSQSPAAAPAKPAGKWWVQLGSFSSADNAQRLARELRGKGFSVEVSAVKSGGKELHRVRAGPEADRTAATGLRTRLAAAGQQGTLVAP